MFKKVLSIILVLSLLTLAGCSKDGKDSEKVNDQQENSQSTKTEDNASSEAKEPQTIKVAFKEHGTNANTKWMEKAVLAFEELYPNIKVELSPILSQEGDYNTKTSLILQTDDTVDVMLLDSFLVPPLVAGESLSAIPVDEWSDWDEQFSDNIRAGMTFNGEVYAIPISTDTRGLYYNEEVFKSAGISVPWEPKNWEDILMTVQTLHDAGVNYPIWINASKAQGEATTMQTFEMLLSGTDDWIYEDNQWVAKSEGFTNSLKFIQELRDRGIYDNNELATMLDTNGYQILNTKFVNTKEIGISLNGNWLPNELDGIDVTQYETIKVVPMPKENGQGFTSMSGGWTLGIAPLSDKKAIAFDFIKVATNRDNLVNYSNLSGDMTPRKDVANVDEYKEYSTYRYEMSAYTDYTHFRPGNELYPTISTEIQSAVESVIIGEKTAEEAAKEYAGNIKSIAGDGNWIEK